MIYITCLSNPADRSKSAWGATVFDSIENCAMLINSIHVQSKPMSVVNLTTPAKQSIANFFKRSRFRDERMIVVLLIVALSSVFLFGNDRGHFNRNYDWTSSSTMAQAANLSPEHNFLTFHYQTLDDEGNPKYAPYTRYPIGGYILVKLAMLPFQNDLSAQIYAARILTLILFSATVVLAYLAIARITNNRWAALAAAMLSFASYNMLYHTDMIGEGVVSLFGVMLTFHGMTIFIQEGRFRQLLVKTCVALFLGWHVYALLFVFIVLGILNELIRNRSNIFSMSTRMTQLKATSMMLIRSRYLMLGIVALVFGASVLTFNLTNEYLAFNREIPLTELPSFQSIIARTGINPVFVERSPDFLNWPNFLRNQIYRIGGMSIPYYWPGYDNALNKHYWQGVIIGSITLLAAFATLRFTRHKILIAALVLSGILWTVVMRSTTGIHPYETIFFIGIPLTVFSICFNKLSSKRLIAGTAVFALIIFAVSAYQMSLIGHDDEVATLRAETLKDFQAIYEIANDKIIHLRSSQEYLHRFVLGFYLTGNIILFPHQENVSEFADLIITRENETQRGLLTPQNKRLFLYDRKLYDQQYQAIYDMAQATEPVISSQFNVYLDHDTLFYVKEQCETADLESIFFLHITPVNHNDLPEERQQFAFDNLDFDFYLHGRRFNQKCAAQVQLPEYEIASIRTGQFIYSEGELDELWSGSYDIPQSRQYQAIYDMAQTAEPVVQSHFNVHLDQNTLFYIKEQCETADLEARFFLHITPVNRNDLPEERQQFAFDNLDFDFAKHGGIFDQKCAAQVQLPEYEIAGMHTGQYIPGEGELWSRSYNIPQEQQ